MHEGRRRELRVRGKEIERRQKRRAVEQTACVYEEGEERMDSEQSIGVSCEWIWKGAGIFTDVA